MTACHDSSEWPPPMVQKGMTETGQDDVRVGQCRVCHRALKREPWRSAGIGQTCARKTGVHVSPHRSPETATQTRN